MMAQRSDSDLQSPSGRRRHVSMIGLCGGLAVVAVVLIVAGLADPGVLVAVAACMVMMGGMMALMTRSTGSGDHRR